MKIVTALALAAVLLSSCNSTADPQLMASNYGPHLQPIPGSITYGGQPRTRLTKSPVGSTFTHQFNNSFGNPTIEQYRINEDRTLEIISRRVVRIPDN